MTKDGWKDYGDLSAVEPPYQVAMTCERCRTKWLGCWDNFQCPECGDGELPGAALEAAMGKLGIAGGEFLLQARATIEGLRILMEGAMAAAIREAMSCPACQGGRCGRCEPVQEWIDRAHTALAASREPEPAAQGNTSEIGTPQGTTRGEKQTAPQTTRDRDDVATPSTPGGGSEEPGTSSDALASQPADERGIGAEQVSEAIDIEEDDLTDAWAVAPTEACWFTALAVFREKKHAQEYADRINRSKRLNGGYGDCVIVPAVASVTCANTFDAKAGRAALEAAKEPKR